MQNPALKDRAKPRKYQNFSCDERVPSGHILPAWPASVSLIAWRHEIAPMTSPTKPTLPVCCKPEQPSLSDGFNRDRMSDRIENKLVDPVRPQPDTGLTGPVGTVDQSGPKRRCRSAAMVAGTWVGYHQRSIRPAAERRTSWLGTAGQDRLVARLFSGRWRPYPIVGSSPLWPPVHRGTGCVP